MKIAATAFGVPPTAVTSLVVDVVARVPHFGNGRHRDLNGMFV
ncbi:hypothetical protein [Cellulomonas biazotea]|nr:hypothetical protein [Cellulomonas biazotea]